MIIQIYPSSSLQTKNPANVGLDAMIYYYMIRICIVLINIVPGKPN